MKIQTKYELLNIKRPPPVHNKKTLLLKQKGNEKAQIIILGDVHYGHVAHDNELFEKVLNWLYEQEDTWVITNGDLCEIGTRYSHGLYDQVISPEQQIDDMIDYLEPLAKKKMIIGMISGNHEYRIRRDGSLFPTKTMATTLGVPFFGIGAFIEFHVKKRGSKKKTVKDMYITHGNTGAYTRQGKRNACERLSNICRAHIYCMGHVHELDSWKSSIYNKKNGKLVKEEITYVLTGSYLGYWQTYAQRKGYTSSSSLGSPKIYIHTDTERISVKI